MERSLIFRNLSISDIDIHNSDPYKNFSPTKSTKRNCFNKYDIIDYNNTKKYKYDVKFNNNNNNITYQNKKIDVNFKNNNIINNHNMETNNYIQKDELQYNIYNNIYYDEINNKNNKTNKNIIKCNKNIIEENDIILNKIKKEKEIKINKDFNKDLTKKVLYYNQELDVNHISFKVAEYILD
jgi:hypothetical protein